MKKNMYSLMLSDDIVEAVDRLAYESGTNRSNMINRILAEYFSYRTPEMRISEMFETMENLLSSAKGLKVVLRPSDSFFNLRSAISYKYNPTVNYSIVLYSVITDAVGELRASLRTQNSSLKLYIMRFYKLWSKIERAYTGKSEYEIDGEKYTKRLVLYSASPDDISEEELCKAIVDYINAFDKAIKAYFYNLDNAPEAVAQVEAVYRDYRTGSNIII